MQKILSEIPKRDIAVYAIWLPMLPSDAREAWNIKLLEDARARHFWDAGAKVAGRWFRDHIKVLRAQKAPGADHMQGAFGNKHAAWDVYFLYPPSAKWEDRPEKIVSWGRPVFQVERELRRDLKVVLKDK